MLPTLKVADSEFIGYVYPISSKEDARSHANSLRKEFPSAGHVAFAWIVLASEDGTQYDAAFEEDGEPPESTGPALLQQLKRFVTKDRESGEHGATAANAKGFVLVASAFRVSFARCHLREIVTMLCFHC